MIPRPTHDPHEPLFVEPPHPASFEDAALLEQCELGRGRTRGPGGQHRNKVESAVYLTHISTGVESQGSERRSAHENQRVALFRLRLSLAVRVRTPIPAGEIRSALWLSRCSADGRIACNPEHHDYPTLLAQALDVLWACRLDPRTAGLRLACSSSQLIKLIKDHPAAFVRVNEARHAAALHPLH